MEEPGVVTFNGQPFPLDIGQNIVGRAAAGSPANIQIPTPDVYCSRQQAIITVVRMPDNSLCTYIRNFKNKNTTMINGALLGEGEDARSARIARGLARAEAFSWEAHVRGMIDLFGGQT